MRNTEGTQIRSSSGNLSVYNDPNALHVGVLSPTDNTVLDTGKKTERPVGEIVLLDVEGDGKKKVFGAQIGPIAATALLKEDVTITRYDSNGSRIVGIKPPISREIATTVVEEQREKLLELYGLEGLLTKEGDTAGVAILEIPELQIEEDQAKRQIALAELKERGVPPGLILQIGLTAVTEPEDYKEAASVLHQLGVLPLPKKQTEEPTDTDSAPNTTTARVPLDVNNRIIQLTRSGAEGTFNNVIN